jgi:hypothetical protein
MGGRDECGEEGRAPRPFIGSGGSGAARRGRGSGGRWRRHQCRSSGSVGRGNGRVSGCERRGRRGCVRAR